MLNGCSTLYLYVYLLICIYNNDDWRRGNYEILGDFAGMRELGGMKEGCESNKLITELHLKIF